MPYWLDGNNLIGQAATRAREDPAVRRAFLAELSLLARSRGGRFVVFFDGDDCHGSSAPPGVLVRFCAPMSTDDTMLRRLEEARLPSEVIVVTNDRSLASRCRDAGAKTMDWQTFLLRMRRNAPRNVPSPGAKEEKVDLDEWIRFFGFDKKTLR